MKERIEREVNKNKLPQAKQTALPLPLPVPVPVPALLVGPQTIRSQRQSIKLEVRQQPATVAQTAATASATASLRCCRRRRRPQPSKSSSRAKRGEEEEEEEEGKRELKSMAPTLVSMKILQ